MKTVILSSLVVLFSCSTQVYRPSSKFKMYDSREINDEDIKKAYLAKPQIKKPVRVAFYNMTGKDDGLGKKLKENKLLKSIYTIPDSLVSGFSVEPNHYRSYERKPAVSLKKLRLFGARSHSDLLIVYLNRTESSLSLNALSFTGILILPFLVLPVYDLEVKMKVEAYIIDIRNGYLYSQINIEEKKTYKYLTMYTNVIHTEKLVEKLKKIIFPKLIEEINNTINSNLNKLSPETTIKTIKTIKPQIETDKKMEIKTGTEQEK
jgi:uncharacterized protein YlbG (UPF0298 family)